MSDDNKITLEHTDFEMQDNEYLMKKDYIVHFLWFKNLLALSKNVLEPTRTNRQENTTGCNPIMVAQGFIPISGICMIGAFCELSSCCHQFNAFENLNGNLNRMLGLDK